MAPLLIISKVIGSNSFGVISEGQYLGIPVTVQKIFSDCTEGNELPVIRKLEHANVQKILYFQDMTDKDSLCRWVVFGLSDLTLDDYLHSHFHKIRHPMPADVEALIQLAKGIEFIDSKKLIHGAIRPTSVLVCVSNGGRVVLKISQAGLMILPRGVMSQSNAFGFDSLSYWSPELLRVLEKDSDSLPFSMAADVFSLGCIFYGYVTKGKHPFGHGAAILSNIVEGRNSLARITDHPAVEVIRQMIENDPKSRPSTGDLVSKLTALQRKAAPRTAKVPVICVSPVPFRSKEADHDRYINEFRVNRCSKTNCKEQFCFNYHQPNQRRRWNFLKEDGTLNYSGGTVCPLYNKETGKCPNGDGCRHLHENVGNTERGFHLSNYKVELCTRKNCTFPHCSFAHGDADVRRPVYGRSEQKPGSNKDNSSIVMGHDKILMSYKIEQCQYAFDQCPKKGTCFKYHIFKTRSANNTVIISSTDKRRCINKHAYWSRRCPIVYDSGKDLWRDPSLCPSGDSCRYCHTNVEHQYHALIYKTEDCNYWKQGDCKRGQLCAFAHDDKRKPKQFQEGDSNLERLMQYLEIL